VEVRVDLTLTYRQIGLSHGDSDQSPADIDYAAYLRATDFKVIEGGVEKYWLQQILVAGDVVRVAVEGGKIKYYINSTAVYTSTATPTYPLLVDSSISLIGTKLVNVYLCTPCLVSEAVAAPASTRSVSSVYNPFGYAGEYIDAESGLTYLRARYYDRSTQQFLTRDPMEAESGQPYAYTGGNPTNAKDPTGQLFWLIPIAVILVGGIALNMATDVGVKYVFDDDKANFDWAHAAQNAAWDPLNYLVIAGPVSKAPKVASGFLTVLGKTAGLKELGYLTADNVGMPTLEAISSGCNLLGGEIPKEIARNRVWRAWNQPFIDNAIARADDILLASPLTRQNLFNGSWRMILKHGIWTPYGTEVAYLRLYKGYQVVRRGDQHYAVPFR
jgi:RHS repeat-associated protein